MALVCINIRKSFTNDDNENDNVEEQLTLKEDEVVELINKYRVVDDVENTVVTREELKKDNVTTDEVVKVIKDLRGEKGKERIVYQRCNPSGEKSYEVRRYDTESSRIEKYF